MYTIPSYNPDKPVTATRRVEINGASIANLPRPSSDVESAFNELTEVIKQYYNLCQELESRLALVLRPAPVEPASAECKDTSRNTSLGNMIQTQAAHVRNNNQTLGSILDRIGV